MKTRNNLLALTAFVLAVTPLASKAQIITQFNFNNSTTNPSTGTGTVGLLGGVTSTFGTGSPEDTGSPNAALQTTTYPAQGTGSGTAGVEFSVSTNTFAGSIQISFDFRQSGTSSKYFQLELSTDGTTFTNASGGLASFGTVNSPNSGTTFTNAGLYSNNSGSGSQSFVEDLSYTLPASSVYANDPNFAFAFVAVFDPTTGGTSYTASNSAYATTGNTRFDEVTVDQVPEPSTYALMGTACFGLAAFIRRRPRARG